MDISGFTGAVVTILRSATSLLHGPQKTGFEPTIVRMEPPKTVGNSLERTCAECGNLFIKEKTSPPNIKYCSTRCRNKARARMKRERKRDARVHSQNKAVAGEEGERRTQVRSNNQQLLDMRWTVIEEFKEDASCDTADRRGLDWTNKELAAESEPLLEICMSCPALVECTSTVMANRETGIWGGGIWSHGRQIAWKCPKCEQVNPGDTDVCSNCQHNSVLWKVVATAAARDGRIVRPRSFNVWDRSTAVILR